MSTLAVALGHVEVLELDPAPVQFMPARLPMIVIQQLALKTHTAYDEDNDEDNDDEGPRHDGCAADETRVYPNRSHYRCMRSVE